MPQIDVLAVSAAVFLIFLYFKRNNARSSLPLPPGPKGLPVIGNLLDMPTSFEWETYHKWSKELGTFLLWFAVIWSLMKKGTDTDILYLNLAGTPLVVLDTSEAAMELLEKRSSIYSGRSLLLDTPNYSIFTTKAGRACLWWMSWWVGTSTSPLWLTVRNSSYLYYCSLMLTSIRRRSLVIGGLSILRIFSWPGWQASAPAFNASKLSPNCRSAIPTPVVKGLS